MRAALAARMATALMVSEGRYLRACRRHEFISARSVASTVRVPPRRMRPPPCTGTSSRPQPPAGDRRAPEEHLNEPPASRMRRHRGVPLSSGLDLRRRGSSSLSPDLGEKRGGSEEVATEHGAPPAAAAAAGGPGKPGRRKWLGFSPRLFRPLLAARRVRASVRSGQTVEIVADGRAGGGAGVWNRSGLFSRPACWI